VDSAQVNISAVFFSSSGFPQDRSCHSQCLGKAPFFIVAQEKHHPILMILLIGSNITQGF
jgi:hypothetical protein